MVNNIIHVNIAFCTLATQALYTVLYTVQFTQSTCAQSYLLLLEYRANKQNSSRRNKMYCFVLQKNNNNAKMNTTVVTITKQSCHESSLDNKAKGRRCCSGKKWPSYVSI